MNAMIFAVFALQALQPGDSHLNYVMGWDWIGIAFSTSRRGAYERIESAHGP